MDAPSDTQSGIPISINYNKVFFEATHWQIPTDHPARLCGTDDKACSRKAVLLCTRCRVAKYCSPACQKREWKGRAHEGRAHKDHCVPYHADPVHDIVSYDPQDPTYYAALKASPDRPNIFLKIEPHDNPYSPICTQLMQQYMEHHHRVGFYGAARYPKTIILLRDQKYCNEMIGIIRQLLAPNYMTKGETKRWIKSLHGGCDREATLKEWSRVESSFRILLTPSLSELEMIVPDVETVIVVSREGPTELGPRWQRMARMCGQKGTYLQVVPANDDGGLDCGDWLGNKVCRRTHALEALTGSSKEAGT